MELNRLLEIAADRETCDTCLYAKNCQFLAKKRGEITSCTAYINTHGVKIDRLQELAEAEKEGRLVVKPKCSECGFVMDVAGRCFHCLGSQQLESDRFEAALGGGVE